MSVMDTNCDGEIQIEEVNSNAGIYDYLDKFIAMTYEHAAALRERGGVAHAADLLERRRPEHQ